MIESLHCRMITKAWSCQTSEVQWTAFPVYRGQINQLIKFNDHDSSPMEDLYVDDDGGLSFSL